MYSRIYLHEIAIFQRFYTDIITQQLQLQVAMHFTTDGNPSYRSILHAMNVLVAPQ